MFCSGFCCRFVLTLWEVNEAEIREKNIIEYLVLSKVFFRFVPRKNRIQFEERFFFLPEKKPYPRDRVGYPGGHCWMGAGIKLLTYVGHRVWDEIANPRLH